MGQKSTTSISSNTHAPALYNNILATYGHTPHVRVNRLFSKFTEGTKTTVWVKQERMNPMHSIKDRIAIAMIEEAEKEGIIKPGKTKIIEATSGNTGIGLAMVGAVKGYKVLLTMPDSCSLERRRLFQIFGAECIIVPREIGAKKLIDLTQQIIDKDPTLWWPKQFSNKSNPQVHINTTSQEIIQAFNDKGGVDILVGGVGTGGHMSGCTQALRVKWPKLKSYAVEPEEIDILGVNAKGTWSPHKVMGTGPDFRPENYYSEIFDGIIKINSDQSWEFSRKSAREEGVLVGISSGSCLAGVEQLFLQDRIPKGSTVVTFNYDSGERYLSVPDLFPYKEETMMGVDLLSGADADAFHQRTLNKYK